MPELPEVETVARSLQPLLCGQTIQRLHCYWPRVIAPLPLDRAAHKTQLTFQSQHLSVRRLQKKLQNSVIHAVGRRAKLLILDMRYHFVLIHLRMTGKLYLQTKISRAKKHLSAAFLLENGHYLLFEDQRRFGRIYYCPNYQYLQTFLARYGPEPLARHTSASPYIKNMPIKFSKKWLAEALVCRNQRIKTLLLDQSFLAGLGNIYIDEVLWLARIHPCRIAKEITPVQSAALYNATRRILRRAIQANGTSFMNFRFLGGQEGGYTDQLLVFRRTNQPCLRCEHSIERIVVAQRATHICPRCQI